MRNIIIAISSAIAEGSKLWNTWLKSRDKRRMEAAIEAAEKYIFVSQRVGEYKDISDSRQKQLLRHYAKRFFHYN